MKLPHVFLGKHRSGYFYFENVQIVITDKKGKKSQHNVDLSETPLTSFKIPDKFLTDVESCDIKLEVVVRFRCRVTGSFPQNLLVDFGKEPLLMREFNIDVVSHEDTMTRLMTVRQDLSSEAARFDESKVIRDENNDEERQLVSTYKLPTNPESFVSAQMINQSSALSPDSYANIMHQMLYSEEAHMKNLLTRLVDV